MSKLLTNIFICVIVAQNLVGCTTAPEISSPEPEVKPVAKGMPVYERAIQLAKSGKDNEALEQFALMTRQHPELAIGYTNLGLLQLKSANYELAQQTLERAIMLDPGDKVAHNHLGVCLRQQGQFNKARQSYLQALKIDDNYTAAHLNLGILYDIYLDELPSALKHYQRFQSLAGGTDQQVAKWIIDLERRIPATKKK
jgi:Flp pilus assembly protein TadD